MICPCKDCENKGCGEYHSKCEPYLQFAQWRKDVNERARIEKNLSYNKNAAKKRR